MNRIKVQDIDFSLLNTMSNQGSKSIIYEDDNSYLANVDGVIGWIYK